MNDFPSHSRNSVCWNCFLDQALFSNTLLLIMHYPNRIGLYLSIITATFLAAFVGSHPTTIQIMWLMFVASKVQLHAMIINLEIYNGINPERGISNGLPGLAYVESAKGCMESLNFPGSISHSSSFFIEPNIIRGTFLYDNLSSKDI